jgi:glycerol-3-phosphate O-acyltransferase
VLQYFKKNAHNSVKSKDRLKKIQNLGSRMYKRNAIELSESMSKITYVNAIDYFTSHRVKGSENVEQITFYEDTIHKFRQCIDT